MARASLTPIAILPLGLLGACQCAEQAGDSDMDASATISTSSTGAAGSSTSPDDGSLDDASRLDLQTDDSDGRDDDDDRFLGVFHTETWSTPFGREVPQTGSQKLVNVDIRPDGTASMMLETCSLFDGTTVIEWYWEPRPGPWIELLPGPGEEVLRFMWRPSADSVRATIDDECAMMFEVDGEMIVTEIFRPGRACWVNRCETFDTVHIDYCEGEEPPPCE